MEVSGQIHALTHFPLAKEPLRATDGRLSGSVSLTVNLDGCSGKGKNSLP